MILVDTALRRRAAEGRPVRVALIGAGFMARGIAFQLERRTVGLQLVGVAARDPERGKAMLAQVTERSVLLAQAPADLERAAKARQIAVCEDALMLCRSDVVDVVVEVTGAIEHGARVSLAAIAAGKHVVLMNAELDATLGPLLARRAAAAGVVLTNADGDQPGVIGNLFRFVAGMGLEPLLAGNVKGLQDPYRTPATQAAFAARWQQQAPVVTSFADGSKISFEQAIVANAFGLSVAQRGMLGPVVEPGTDVQTMPSHYPDWLWEGSCGYVDYVVGAHPAPGVFVIARETDAMQRHYLEYYKMGTGPLYCFHTPYHLCHLEVHATIARAALFCDAALVAASHRVDVVATAKCDLAAGTVLDGIGGFHQYGQCENVSTTIDERLLPLGVAEGCTLLHDVSKDATLTYDDVELPPDRLIDRLRLEQSELPASTASNVAMI